MRICISRSRSKSGTILILEGAIVTVKKIRRRRWRDNTGNNRTIRKRQTTSENLEEEKQQDKAHYFSRNGILNGSRHSINRYLVFLLKGTGSRDGYFLKDINILINTFCVYADAFKGTVRPDLI
jgi:hypothetical protein